MFGFKRKAQYQAPAVSAEIPPRPSQAYAAPRVEAPAPAPKRWAVTRYQDGELIGYVAENWNHVGCLLATGRIVSYKEI